MASPLSILILDAQDANAEPMLQELRRAGYMPDWKRVDNEQDYVAHLSNPPDLILAVYSLPQFDAARALHLLREHGLDIPCIVISGSIGEEKAVELIKGGATDYLLNDKLARLSDAVQRAMDEKQLRTVQKKTSAALAFLASIVESSEDAIIGKTLDGAILSWNAGATKMYGYTAEEAVGQSIFMLSPPDLHAEVRDMLDRLKAGEHITQFETTRCTKDGQLFDVSLTISPLRGSDGRPNAASIVAHNITARKLTEEQLRASEQRYRSLTDNFPNSSVAVYDRDLRMTFVTGMALAQSGKTAAQFIGKHFTEVAPPETWVIAEPHLRAALEGTPGSYETPYWGGQYYAVSLAPMRDAHGDVNEVLVLSYNITKSRHAVQALRESEERFRRLAENAPDVIFRWGISPPGIEYLSPAVFNITGYTPEEFMADPGLLMTITHPDDQETMRAIITGQKPFRPQEVRIIHKDGRIVWIERRSSPVYDSAGTLVATEGIVRDITDNKQAEETLRYHAGLLDQLSDAVISTDLDFKILSWNRAAELIYGWTAGEALGQNMGVLIPTEYQYASPPDVLARFQRDGFWQGEALQDRKEGPPASILSSVLMLKDAAGTPTGIVAVNRDRTQRKQAEEALHESERFALSTINALADNLCVLDEHGIVLTVNQAWREFADRNPPLIQHYGIGTNYLAICEAASGDSAEGADCFATGLRSVMYSERDDFAMEYACHEPDGEQRWFVATVTRFAGPGPLRIVVTHKNITERKAAVDRVQASETRYRRLFEAAQDGILILDFATGQIDDANPFLRDLLGYSLEELLGKMLWEISPFKQLTASRDAFIELRDAGYIRYEDLPLETKTGEQVQVEFVSNVYQANGIPVIQCNIRDITERKQAEREMAQRARYLSLINNIGRRVTTLTDLGLLLETTAEVTQQSFGYDHVGIYIADPARNDLLLRAKAGSYTSRFPVDHRIKMGQGMIGWTAREGQRILSNDISTEPRFHNPFSEEIIRAELDVPIKVGDELLGVLGIQSRNINAFSENDIIVLETLADQIAIAIHNARLFAAERDQRTVAEALAASASVLNTTLDLNEVLQRILEVVGRVLPHDAKTIMLAQGGIASVVSHTGYEERDLGEAASKLSLVIANTPNLARMAETGHSFCVSDTHAYHGWLANEAMDWIGSSIGAPIRLGGEILGFINLDSAVPGFFNDEQAARLQAFAHQAAAAVRNAQLYHELETYSGILEQAVAERTSELQASTRRVGTILDSIGDALLVLGLDGRIQQVNPAFEQQTGHTIAEAQGQDHHDLLKLEFGSKSDYQMLLKNLKSGKIWHGQTPVLRKDDSIYDADLTVAPVLDDEGGIGLLVAVLRDITPLKEIERAKDEFISNVSHELRTPITGIKLNYSMLSMDPEKRDVYMTRIGREINRLNELIEDLLRLTRLEQGSLELALTSVDLNEIGSQLVHDRAPVAEARNLSLTFVPALLETVRADAGLLGQALSALLTNAMNYTPANGQIVVRSVSDPNHAARMGLSVADTGPGILPAEQEKLFERFYRGTVGRASGAPGTGLGLNIARQIVERQSGQLEVSSKGIAGKGSIFTLWLPTESNNHE